MALSLQTTHPIHQIPSEILAEIFYHCPVLRYESISDRRSILVLSQVSRYWRSLALSTPTLWTYLLVQVQKLNNPQTVNREHACACNWLSRSGQLPLEIAFDIPAKASYVEPVFQLLASRSSRWGSIKLLALPTDSPTWQRLQVPGKLPMLESLDIRLGVMEHIAFVNVFAIASNLRRLKLHITDPMRSISHLSHFPWIQLTQVDLTIHVTPALFEILALASNAVRLRVSLQRQVFSGDVEPQIIMHPNLSELDIRAGSNDSSAVYLMDHLSLPSLRTLSLYNAWRNTIPLISRSACDLHALSTHMSPVTDFMEILRLAPELQDLSITSRNVDEWDAMVECLTLRGDLQMVSKLRSLDFHFLFTPGRLVDMHFFADMLQSRWQRTDASLLRPPLQRVTVEFVDSRRIRISDATRSRLLRLVKEGLDITLLAGFSRQRLI